MNKKLVVIFLVCALLMGTQTSFSDFGQDLINGTFDTDLNGWLINTPDVPNADGVVWYDQAAVLLNPGDFPLDHTSPFSDTFTFLQSYPNPAGGDLDHSSLYQLLTLSDNVDEISFDVTMEVYNRESMWETDVFTATVWYGPGCSESERIYRLSSTDALGFGLPDNYIVNEEYNDGVYYTHHVIYNIAASYDVSKWAGQDIILEFVLDHEDDGIRTAVTLDDVAISEAGDVTPPAVTVGEMIELWPPNHKYRTFNLSDCVVSVSDDTDDLDIDEAGTILSIYSDEPEDVKGRGDGSTMDDIVVLGTSSFKVRAERQGTNNGRVYGVTFMVEDAAGNSTVATFYLGVPHDRSGHSPIIDDGAESGYTVDVF